MELYPSKFLYLCGKYDILKCSSGNVSYRIDENFINITKSGLWIPDEWNEENIWSKVNINSLEFYGDKPSSELPLHLEIYRNNQYNIILHCQSEYATYYSCFKDRFNKKYFSIIPEVSYYVRNIDYVDYFKPGSVELAKNVSLVSKNSDYIFMRNHGQIVLGNSFENVLQKAIFMELACKILSKDLK